MVKISPKASSSAWQRAIVKATARHQAGIRAKHLGGGRYEVPSATSSAACAVDVRNVTPLQASCICPHGRYAEAEPHCWHACLALGAETERVSRKRPAPKPAPRPKLPPAAMSPDGAAMLLGVLDETMAGLRAEARGTLDAAAVDATMRRLFPGAAAWRGCRGGDRPPRPAGRGPCGAPRGL